MSTGGRRRRLLAVWIVLAALIAAIAVIEHRESSRIPPEVAEKSYGVEGSRMMLPVPVSDLGTIEIGAAGTIHRFERDAAGAWFYHGVHASAQATHEHKTDMAQAEIIEKAFAALGRTRMERQVPLDVQAGAYGLTTPQMIIIVYGKSNPLPLAQFAVGDLAPDGQSRYVLPVGGKYAVTIANYQIENLYSLLDRMKAAAQPPAAAPGKR